MEDDDLVDAVQELGAERLLELLAQAPLDLLVLAHLSRGTEAERIAPLLVGPGRADVGGHDDHGVAEVDRSTVAISQPTVVEDLQQGVEHLRVRLFDFVEEDDLVGPSAHRFGELAALVEPDVAWRRPEQTTDRVRLHVLGHVQPQQGVFIVEQVIRQRLGQLGLTDAGGSQEQERTDRPLRVAQTRPRAPNRVGDGDDSLVLVDHPGMQRLFQVQQLGGFFGVQALDRHTRPGCDDSSDVLRCHGCARHAPFDLRQRLGELFLEPQTVGFGLCRGFVVAVVPGGVLLELQPLDAGGGAVRLFDGSPQAHLGRGLVHQVDGLVRQAAILDVALAEPHGGLQRLLADAQLMVLLVTRLQPFEDLQRLFRRGLVHVHGREAPLERRVGLDALPIFVVRGCADQTQLAARQSRLEQVGTIQSAFGVTRADERV